MSRSGGRATRPHMADEWLPAHDNATALALNRQVRFLSVSGGTLLP